MAKQRLPAAERRKLIIRAALKCFTQHGYRGATTKRIAREAGVAEALLYRYFGSKDALFMESVQAFGDPLLDGLEALLEKHAEHPIEALRALLEFYRKQLKKHRGLARAIFLVTAELDEPAVREVYLPYQKRALAALTHTIEGWQSRNLLSSDVSARALAWLFLGTYQVIALMRHAEHADRIPMEEALQLVQPFLKSGM